MARMNVLERTPAPVTHEGAPAKRITAEQQLRRSVMSCLLWEKEFYEDGQSIADRVAEYAVQVEPWKLATIAVEARQVMHLRHVSLLLLNVLTKTGKGSSLVSETFPQVIQRADELAEFLALYWKDGKHPLSAQAKKGLAAAFANFDAYQLAKYDRAGKVRLRDVMFLAHPKAEGERADWYKKLAANELEAPDTWEVALSGGAAKKETFERLLDEGKLGYLALLRNLRGMDTAGVASKTIETAIMERRGASNVLPFRYVAAARACPKFEPALDVALGASLATMRPLDGHTVVLVDVSGSMEETLSAKSDMKRIDAAAALATFVKDAEVYSFSNRLVRIPPRTGMAMVDAIQKSQEHAGTNLGGAVEAINASTRNRLIVITDEQSRTPVPEPLAEKAYMINVASAKNGVGYGKKWLHIDGFSENVLRYIAELEK